MNDERGSFKLDCVQLKLLKNTLNNSITYISINDAFIMAIHCFYINGVQRIWIFAYCL